MVFAFTMMVMAVSDLTIMGQVAPRSVWACCSTP
jgi:hypothetical protein